MATKKKYLDLDDIGLIGKQEKKSPTARKHEIQKTGEMIRAHKQASSGKMKKAS